MTYDEQQQELRSIFRTPEPPPLPRFNIAREATLGALYIVWTLIKVPFILTYLLFKHSLDIARLTFLLLLSSLGLLVVFLIFRVNGLL